MIRTARLIRHEWGRNHRHHGGVAAVARCLAGSLAVRSGLAARRRRAAEVEVLTFSVVPWLTTLWARLLGQVLAARDAEVLIGDGSGGIGEEHRGVMAPACVRVVPCLNRHHGEKIDLFLARVCRASYVVVADDDVFWLDGEPLAWALAELEADPRVAAVSLKPRRVVSSPLERDGVTEPMGSHCVVVRRELWRRERLSFAVASPPEGVDDWFYDTGDLANRELLRRGYRVAIAPPELEERFAAFDGVSAWVLKLQGQSPERLSASVEGIPVRQTKALQAIHCVRGLAALLADARLRPAAPGIVPAERLAAAERMLGSHVSAADRDDVRRGVEATLQQIRDRLLAREARR